MSKVETLKKLQRIADIVHKIKYNATYKGKLVKSNLQERLLLQSKEILTAVFKDDVYKDVNASVQGDWGDYTDTMDKMLILILHI